MTMKSTMTRERAIEIAQHAAAYEPHRPSYWTPPVNGEQTFQPHEWVIGAILNAAHFACCERFDASELIELVDAWIDVPGEGKVPVGLGEPMQRLLAAVGKFIGRDEMLKQPEVQRRTEIATAKARVAWTADQLYWAKHHGIAAEVDRLTLELDAAQTEARKLGIEITP